MRLYRSIGPAGRGFSNWKICRGAFTRDNVYVFIDEAHRSVAQDLGTYLMAAVPKARIVGFTGTPVDRTAHGEGTFKIFGIDDEQKYLDRYPIIESISDETTLPIRHTMAPSTLTVPAEQLNNSSPWLKPRGSPTSMNSTKSSTERSACAS